MRDREYQHSWYLEADCHYRLLLAASVNSTVQSKLTLAAVRADAECGHKPLRCIGQAAWRARRTLACVAFMTSLVAASACRISEDWPWLKPADRLRDSSVQKCR